MLLNCSEDLEGAALDKSRAMSLAWLALSMNTCCHISDMCTAAIGSQISEETCHGRFPCCPGYKDDASCGKLQMNKRDFQKFHNQYLVHTFTRSYVHTFTRSYVYTFTRVPVLFFNISACDT
jgi:hypothetical protein